jgi:hypothetical protein
VGYRPDKETDPLEIMIARQRLWRYAVVFALLLGIVRLLWRHGFANLVAMGWFLFSAASAMTPSAPVSAGSTTTLSPPAPVAKVVRLTAAQVEQQLRAAPVSSGSPRNHTCVPGEKGWDYVCAYSAANPAAIRMKIGVRVGPTEIMEASMPYPVYASLPPAPGL